MHNSVAYRYQGVFRLCLSLIVVFHHSRVFFLKSIGTYLPTTSGLSAVAVFFVVSGYLMYSGVQSFYWFSLKRFLMNRFLRIAPAFVLACFVYYAVAYILMRFYHDYYVDRLYAEKEMFSLDNLLYSIVLPLYPFDSVLRRLFSLTSTYGYLEYSWAIITELTYYYMLAAYVFVYRKYGYKVVAGAAFVLPMALCCIFLFQNHIKVFAVVAGWAGGVPGLNFLTEFIWSAQFLLGICVYNVSMAAANKRVYWIFACICLLVISLVPLRNSDIMSLLLYVALVVAFWMICVSDSAGKFFAAVGIDRATDRWVGELTYPVYVLHGPLLILTQAILGAAGYDEGMSLSAGIALFVVYVLFVCVVSFLSVSLIEHAIRPLRSQLRGARL